MMAVGNSYGSAPVNTVAPAVTGTATVGQTLTTTNGTWLGAPAPTFTYQWQRSGSNIGGATSSTYVLVAADYANTIRCVVTATNSVAPSGVSANSNSTAAVAGNAPVNTVAPVVSGTATVGQTLSSTTGTWTGVPTPTFTYQWQRVTTNISGATSSTYVLVAADAGSTIRCVVTGTNAVSAVAANSNSTASVAATVPGAPTIGTATATGSTTATVAYTAPASNGGATITLYTATSSPGGLTGTLATAGSGTITVTGLTAETSYTFTVKATNSVGQSAASAASNSITTTAAFWAVQTTGLQSYERPTTLLIDSSGNTYVTGRASSTADTQGFGYLAKFNSSGTVQWQKTLKVSGQRTIGSGMAFDTSGNIWATVGANDGVKYIMKFDTSGNQLIQSKLGAGEKAVAEYITLDSSNNIYTIGRGTDTSTRVGIAVLKLDSSASSITAQKTLAGNGTGLTNSARAIALDSSGNIYCNFRFRVNSVDIATVCKLDSSLAIQWKRYSVTNDPYYQPSGVQEGASVTDSSGNTYMVHSQNQFSFGGSFVYNMVVTKIDSSGNVSWTTRLGTDRETLGHGIALDSSASNVYVYGYNSPASGPSRGYVIKFNSSGTLQWQRYQGFNATGANTFVGKVDATAVYSSSGISSAGYSAGYAGLAKLPVDGSLTGSYTNFTYTAGDLSTATGPGTGTTGTLNANTQNETIASSSDVVVSTFSGSTSVVMIP
jgi:hypothetical protein